MQTQPGARVTAGPSASQAASRPDRLEPGQGLLSLNEVGLAGQGHAEVLRRLLVIPTPRVSQTEVVIDRMSELAVMHLAQALLVHADRAVQILFLRQTDAFVVQELHELGI